MPEKPAKKDLEAVARKLLPGVGKEAVQFVVGYGLTSKMALPAIVDLVDHARRMAGEQGREEIIFEDVERAMKDYCAPSIAAMSRTFVTGVERRRQPRRSIAIPAPTQAPQKAAAREHALARSAAPIREEETFHHRENVPIAA